MMSCFVSPTRSIVMAVGADMLENVTVAVGADMLEKIGSFCCCLLRCYVMDSIWLLASSVLRQQHDLAYSEFSTALSKDSSSAACEPRVTAVLGRNLEHTNSEVLSFSYVGTKHLELVHSTLLSPRVLGDAPSLKQS